MLDRARIVDVFRHSGHLAINIKMAWSVTDRNIKRGGGSKKGLTSWVLVDILTLIKQAPEEERMTIRTSTVDSLLDAHSYSVKLVATIVTSDCLGETDYNIWCSKNFGRAGRCTCLQPKKKCQLHPQPLLSLSQRICISSPSNSANSLSWTLIKQNLKRLGKYVLFNRSSI